MLLDMFWSNIVRQLYFLFVYNTFNRTNYI